MNISRSQRPRRMVAKNVSIRPDQEDWLMRQAGACNACFSEAIREVIDLAMEADDESANPLVRKTDPDRH